MNLLPPSRRAPRLAPTAAFTMVEIALALAIIGFSLIAIIGVLPLGMDVQKNNRRETIINQDANFFIEAIRGGARGVDDLTNYVMAITVSNLTAGTTFTYTNPFNPPPVSLPIINGQALKLTNGQNIIGLLSRPKYIASGTNNVVTNYVVAYVQALSGAATEKSPQTNDVIREAAFSYRMVVELVPSGVASNGFYYTAWTNYALSSIIGVASPAAVGLALTNWSSSLAHGTNVSPDPVYYLTNYDVNVSMTGINVPEFRAVANYWLTARQMTPNLYDLRLLFRWPVLPGKDSVTGQPKVGTGRQTYRVLVSSSVTNDPLNSPTWFVRSHNYLRTP